MDNWHNQILVTAKCYAFELLFWELMLVLEVVMTLRMAKKIFSAGCPLRRSVTERQCENGDIVLSTPSPAPPTNSETTATLPVVFFFKGFKYTAATAAVMLMTM